MCARNHPTPTSALLFALAEHLQQPHAGRERAVAGRALLQERHRPILEESGAAVSAGALASAAPLSLHHCFRLPLTHCSSLSSPLLCCLIHTVSIHRC